MSGGNQVEEIRQRLRVLRAEMAKSQAQRGVAEWRRLHLETRCILVIAANIEIAPGVEIYDIAQRDWREMPQAERNAICDVAEALRWQLNGARGLRD